MGLASTLSLATNGFLCSGTGGNGETIYMIGATSANIVNVLSTTIIGQLSSSVSSTVLTAEITNKVSTNIDKTTETT